MRKNSLPRRYSSLTLRTTGYVAVKLATSHGAVVKARESMDMFDAGR